MCGKFEQDEGHVFYAVVVVVVRKKRKKKTTHQTNFLYVVSNVYVANSQKMRGKKTLIVG